MWLIKASNLTVFSTSLDPPDENNSNVSFIQWLASVTERINQTMHFQFSGDPDALVFHVPQVFLFPQLNLMNVELHF